MAIMKHIALCTVFVLFCPRLYVQGQTREEWEAVFPTAEKTLIPPGYIRTNIPLPIDTDYSSNDSLTFNFSVYVSLMIASVQDIDEINENVALELEITMYWFDYVITQFAGDKYATGQVSLDPGFLEKIWQPDVLFGKEHKKPETVAFLPGQNSPATGKPAIMFTYKSRALVTVSCKMDFHYYPADTQICPLRLRSFAYTTDRLRLEWLAKLPALLLDQGDPNFSLQISNFGSYTNVIGVSPFQKYYDVLKLDVLARRKISYHLIQTYLPSVFFIVITWICFLLPTEMMEARIGIAMTTLLTLTAMFASVRLYQWIPLKILVTSTRLIFVIPYVVQILTISRRYDRYIPLSYLRESSPTVSYVKAVDIWMVACIFFVFLTLLQFALLVWVKRAGVNAEKKILEGRAEGNGTPENIGDEDVEIRTQMPKRVKKLTRILEKYAFWLFLPICLLFFGAYWAWLLLQSGYTVWAVDLIFNPNYEE